MKIVISGSSKGRLKIQADTKQENAKAVLHELKKTTRKLRRLLKDGYEIDLTLNS